ETSVTAPTGLVLDSRLGDRTLREPRLRRNGRRVDTRRWVLHELLRGVVKDPPPCVDTTPVPTKPGLTQRAIAEARIQDKTCGGCHARFEPLAFGLEKFDGIGAWHENDEHGNALRDDGEILIPGSAKKVAYRTSSELMGLLSKSSRVAESFTWKMTQFALGRPLVAEDARDVATIHAAATKNGGTYQATIRAIVTSELVRTIRTETDQPKEKQVPDRRSPKKNAPKGKPKAAIQNEKRKARNF
ncbi:MAG: DUF1585 domain-containing protein, partial [Planctomycetota bacterium]